MNLELENFKERMESSTTIDELLQLKKDVSAYANNIIEPLIEDERRLELFRLNWRDQWLDFKDECQAKYGIKIRRNFKYIWNRLQIVNKRS